MFLAMLSRTIDINRATLCATYFFFIAFCLFIFYHSATEVFLVCVYAASVETRTTGEPIAQSMRDYCRPTNTSQVSLGFIPATPVNFKIKYSVLLGLREKQFDENANNDPWEHLAKFYETSSMCQPEGITEDQVKPKLFSFSLIGRANDCLLCLSSGVIKT